MRKIISLLCLALAFLCLAACGADTQTPTTTPVCRHDYIGQVAEDASCVSAGIQLFTCSICGDSYSQIIPKLAHEYHSETSAEPSCSVEGATTFTCVSCGDCYTEPIATIAHTYTDAVTMQPTCTTEGVRTYTCTECGAAKTEAVEMIAHNYSSKVTTKATCTTEGIQTLTCRDCGHTDTQTVAKKAHDYSRKVTKAPTCTEKGVQTFSCKDCDASYTESIATVAHDYTDHVTQVATCTAPGVRTFTCSSCGDSYTTSIAMIEHNYVDQVTQAPTCTAQGVRTFTCTGCNDSYTASIAIIDHSYSEQVTKEATCIAEGVKTFTCTGCGDCYTTTIAITDHKYSSTVTAEPNCTAAGIMTYTCDTCGLSHTETIPAKGHRTNSDKLCKDCNKFIPDMTEEEKEVAKTVKYTTNHTLTRQDDQGRYALTFAFNSYSNGTVVPAVVEVYIKNDDGEIVYKATKILQSSDFMDWKSSYTTYKNQATIYIYDEEITQGEIASGDIYFTVYNEGYFQFAEQSLSISKLPLKPITIILPETPMRYEYIYHDSYWGDRLHSVVYISNIRYEIKNDDLYIYFSGTLLAMYFNSYYAKIEWQLLDSSGKVVASDTFYSSTYLDPGETFTDNYDIAYNCIKPGETYTLVIVN